MVEEEGGGGHGGGDEEGECAGKRKNWRNDAGLMWRERWEGRYSAA